MATRFYTCPTWLQIRKYGAFSDIYSVGMTLFGLFTGIDPSEILNSRDKVLSEECAYCNNRYNRNASKKDCTCINSFFKDEWKKEVFNQ